MANLKVALVTGASSGMGKVIAKQLIKDGLSVIVAARRLEKMDDLQALGAHPIALDISNEQSIAAAVSEIKTQFGGVDILVNNAGFGLYGALEDVPMAEARYQFEVNVFGLAGLTQLLVPHMRERKAGKIINISSMGGKVYTPLGAWYHATKHAIEGMSDCLRLELSPFGIDVVIVEPGLIETEFGSVVEGPMLKHSGTGPYANMATSVARATANSYRPGVASSPQIIADIVSLAIKSDRPKTRYAAGKYAKLMIGVRKWLGDRIFDRVILSAAR
ncbi:oxidoreductase [Devosia rhodophyticola]|uniref:Oxidoreductase n=1 Tax=Devosia rhodophyticola TaxID=3026423 RepID=A0ABY7YXP5_9HYPH|nr:oxidoreductase [Devosia rhodophyticola]WDR06086.1 oxidoreductase [Devosia rhodophyticola]